MKPAKFEYFAPERYEEVLALLARYGEDARPLAGGQSLVPLMNMRIARPAALIDLGRCDELDYLRMEGDILVSGAMTRQAVAETSPLVREQCPLLEQALKFLGHHTNRNRGTLGGSLAHADPAAELPGVALALGAELVVDGPHGRRTLAPEDFFVADLTTALEPGELLREIRIAKPDAGSRVAFVESGNRQADFAIAGVAGSFVMGQDGACQSASLAAIGVGPGPVRLAASEAALKGSKLTDAVIGEAAEASNQDIDPANDLHASAHYRRRLTAALVARAVRQACVVQAGAG